MKKLLSVLFMLSFTFAAVWAQNIQIKGTVVSGTDNEPLPGVNVVLKGNTGTGTITDIDGNFHLSVPSDAVLTVSYIGFVTQDVPVNGQTLLKVVLQEDNETLDEVGVIGYGVQKKSVVTASIASVSSEDLEFTSPVRVDNALKGLAAGVQVSTQNGQPGSAAKIRIRGTGTINDSDPLYIVDGMPIGGGIDNINPADIESIEVLKDAASAAVYGARAANGVVLVTTKKGAIGKARVTYDFSYGWQSPWRQRKMLIDERGFAVCRRRHHLRQPRSLGQGYELAGCPVQRRCPGAEPPAERERRFGEGELLLLGRLLQPGGYHRR